LLFCWLLCSFVATPAVGAELSWAIAFTVSH
jgi:hypothetical protein